MKRFILISLSLLTFNGVHAGNVRDGWQQKSHLCFIENKGQITDPLRHRRNDIQFKLETPSVNVLIGNASLHYQWVKNEAVDLKDLRSLAAMKHSDYYRMDVTLIGADPNASILKEDPQSYYERYYLQHLGLNGTIAHSFSKITYQNVYPDIDWVIYTQRSADGTETMKYDFVVHPGGDPALIQLQYSGSTALNILDDGSLKALTPAGSIVEKAPYSFITDKDNHTTSVASSFRLDKNVLSFNVAPSQNTLTIDPSLEWATYYGGAGFDLGTVLNCDNLGNVYLTGASWMSLNIATTGSYQSTNAGDFDAFLAKFDNDGNRLWATYYGGESVDYALGLACDQHNRVYISGITQSTTGIATAGSAQPVYAGIGGDDYLVRFDTAGARIWATYCGSTGDEYNGLCATDNFGHVYLVGNTTGNDNIYSNGHQSTNGGGANDAFIVQYDTSGNKIWGSFYGGSGDDMGDGVACDRIGNVYLSGHTNSTSGIATSGSHQPANGGGYDDYLVKFNMSGVRQWATYYGGSAAENNGNLRNVACDKNNYVYMSGSTESTAGIATTGSYQATPGGGIDAFLVKFNDNGGRLWATYYGGSGDDNGGALACDLSANIFWCGFTTSTDSIATTGSHQTVFAGGSHDAYLTKFNSSGEQIFGTYYGGGGLDEGYAVGFDFVGNAFISGGTTSGTAIATPGAFSTTYAGGIAVFLAKFCTSVTATALNGSDTICANNSILYSTVAVPGATGYIWTLPSGWAGSSDSSSIYVTPNDAGGVITVKVIRCDTSDALQMDIYVLASETPVVSRNGNVLSTTHTFTTYQWYLNDVAINGATSQTYTVNATGSYKVVTTNANGCSDTSVVFMVNSVTAIDELQYLKENVFIYPNPANDILNIQAPVPVKATITGIDGRVLLDNIQSKKIDIHSLSEGLYLIRLMDKNNNLIKTAKFIKVNN